MGSTVNGVLLLGFGGTWPKRIVLRVINMLYNFCFACTYSFLPYFLGSWSDPDFLTLEIVWSRKRTRFRNTALIRGLGGVFPIFSRKTYHWIRAELNTPRARSNTARSFTGIKFVFAGLSLPLKGIYNKFLQWVNCTNLDQHFLRPLASLKNIENL